MTSVSTNPNTPTKPRQNKLYRSPDESMSTFCARVLYRDTLKLDRPEWNHSTRSEGRVPKAGIPVSSEAEFRHRCNHLQARTHHKSRGTILRPRDESEKSYQDRIMGTRPQYYSPKKAISIPWNATQSTKPNAWRPLPDEPTYHQAKLNQQRRDQKALQASRAFSSKSQSTLRPFKKTAPFIQPPWQFTSQSAPASAQRSKPLVKSPPSCRPSQGRKKKAPKQALHRVPWDSSFPPSPGFSKVTPAKSRSGLPDYCKTPNGSVRRVVGFSPSN